VRLAYETFRPIYRGLFVDNVRYALRVRRGHCALLEPGVGCMLPEEAKPVACRLYPFDFDLAGEITLVDAPHCLALDEAEGPAHLLRLFGTSKRALGRLRKQALEEVADHAAALRRKERLAR